MNGFMIGVYFTTNGNIGMSIVNAITCPRTAASLRVRHKKNRGRKIPAPTS